jgi:hypothetical protein
VREVKAARDLTGPQLRARGETLGRRGAEINAALIAAGRGHERPSDIRGKTDPLSVRFNEQVAAVCEVADEQRRRMAWHGTLRPIRHEGY